MLISLCSGELPERIQRLLRVLRCDRRGPLQPVNRVERESVVQLRAGLNVQKQRGAVYRHSAHVLHVGLRDIVLYVCVLDDLAEAVEKRKKRKKSADQALLYILSIDLSI